MAVSAKKFGWQRGREEGLKLGYKSGLYLGRCEAVMQKAALERRPFGFWDIRLLYVTSGKGFPYAPIDQAIIDSLRPLVRELIVGNMDGDPIKLGNPQHGLETLAALHRPDLMLVLDGLNLRMEQVDRIRAQGIRTAIWLTDDPYYTDFTVPMAAHFDMIFTLERNCVALYQEAGCPQVHYLPFASQPQLFRPMPVPVGLQRDISFIGSGYWNRIAFFDQMAPYLSRKRLLITGIWWERLKHYKLLAPQIQLGTWLGPHETAQAYNGAKAVINMHRAFDDQAYNNNSRKIHAVSPNPRTFEISGCGALQVTDVREDLPQFYAPDEEIITYSSPQELMQKLEYYLQHEEERQRIALKGLFRTMRDHTYGNRLSQLLETAFGPGAHV